MLLDASELEVIKLERAIDECSSGPKDGIHEQVFEKCCKLATWCVANSKAERALLKITRCLTQGMFDGQLQRLASRILHPISNALPVSSASAQQAFDQVWQPLQNEGMANASTITRACVWLAYLPQVALTQTHAMSSLCQLFIDLRRARFTSSSESRVRLHVANAIIKSLSHMYRRGLAIMHSFCTLDDLEQLMTCVCEEVSALCTGKPALFCAMLRILGWAVAHHPHGISVCTDRQITQLLESCQSCVGINDGRTVSASLRLMYSMITYLSNHRVSDAAKLTAKLILLSNSSLCSEDSQQCIRSWLQLIPGRLGTGPETQFNHAEYVASTWSQLYSVSEFANISQNGMESLVQFCLDIPGCTPSVILEQIRVQRHSQDSLQQLVFACSREKIPTEYNCAIAWLCDQNKILDTICSDTLRHACMDSLLDICARDIQQGHMHFADNKSTTRNLVEQRAVDRWVPHFVDKSKSLFANCREEVMELMSGLAPGLHIQLLLAWCSCQGFSREMSDRFMERHVGTQGLPASSVIICSAIFSIVNGFQPSWQSLCQQWRAAEKNSSSREQHHLVNTLADVVQLAPDTPEWHLKCDLACIDALHAVGMVKRHPRRWFNKPLTNWRSWVVTPTVPTGIIVQAVPCKGRMIETFISTEFASKCRKGSHSLAVGMRNVCMLVKVCPASGAAGSKAFRRDIIRETANFRWMEQVSVKIPAPGKYTVSVLAFNVSCGDAQLLSKPTRIDCTVNVED